MLFSSIVVALATLTILCFPIFHALNILKCKEGIRASSRLGLAVILIAYSILSLLPVTFSKGVFPVIISGSLIAFGLYAAWNMLINSESRAQAKAYAWLGLAPAILLASFPTQVFLGTRFKWVGFFSGLLLAALYFGYLSRLGGKIAGKFKPKPKKVVRPSTIVPRRRTVRT